MVFVGNWRFTNKYNHLMVDYICIQKDYVLVRNSCLKQVGDRKGIPGEEVVTQISITTDIKNKLMKQTKKIFTTKLHIWKSKDQDLIHFKIKWAHLNINKNVNYEYYLIQITRKCKMLKITGYILTPSCLPTEEP